MWARLGTNGGRKKKKSGETRQRLSLTGGGAGSSPRGRAAPEVGGRGELWSRGGPRGARRPVGAGRGACAGPPEAPSAAGARRLRRARLAPGRNRRHTGGSARRGLPTDAGPRTASTWRAARAALPGGEAGGRAPSQARRDARGGAGVRRGGGRGEEGRGRGEEGRGRGGARTERAAPGGMEEQACVAAQGACMDPAFGLRTAKPKTTKISSYVSF